MQLLEQQWPSWGALDMCKGVYSKGGASSYYAPKLHRIFERHAE